MASGDTIATFKAQSNEPPTASYAVLDTRNSHLILAFDDSADESGVFGDILARHYGGGGLTAYIHYADTAIAGVVIWDVSIERVGEGQQDIDSDGFAAAQSSGSITVPATSGHVDIVPVTFTDGAQMDSIAVGEYFRVKVTRDADNVLDTLVGDAQIIGIELKET